MLEWSAVWLLGSRLGATVSSSEVPPELGLGMAVTRVSVPDVSVVTTVSGSPTSHGPEGEGTGTGGPESTRLEGEGFRLAILDSPEVGRCGLGAGGIASPSGPVQLKSALQVKELSGQHPKPQHIVPMNVLCISCSFISNISLIFKTNLDHIGCAARLASRSTYPRQFRIGPDTSTGPPGTAVRLPDWLSGTIVARTRLSCWYGRDT